MILRRLVSVSLTPAGSCLLMEGSITIPLPELRRTKLFFIRFYKDINKQLLQSGLSYFHCMRCNFTF